MNNLPPDNHQPLAAYCRQHGIRRDVAAKAAARGYVTGAVKVWVPGAPHPVWFVPDTCTWRPFPKGFYPRKTKEATS